MPNGQQIGKINLDNFIVWSSTQSDDDFKKIIYQGKLNKTEIAKSIGCGNSALKQNPALRKAIDDLELKLIHKGILPARQEKENKADVQKYMPDTIINAKEIKRIAILEQQNLELRTKIKELELKLENLSELERSLFLVGILPR
jgi:hypothetical protein